ncbi:MAG: hypothetical protein R6V76_07080 [Desulfobacterales bacterium]
MQIVSNIALITINETLIVQLLSFLIFLFIIRRLMFRPIRSIISERENHIKKIKTDIYDSENAIDNLNDQLRIREDQVKDEAFKLNVELEEKGNKEAVNIFASAYKEIEAIKAQNEKIIEAKISEARKHLSNESEKIAEIIIEKVLNRRLG